METLYKAIILFFTYSLAGWVMEVLLKYRQYGRFINRGFLLGPYLPIYGMGAILVSLLSSLLTPNNPSYASSFLIAFFACGALEYFISYYLEEKFHARWWDYSQKPMNLHGRVWMGNLILFGLGGMMIDRVFNPILLDYIERLSPTSLKWLAIAITIILICDYTFSHLVMKLLKKGVEESKADNTEEISKEVRYLLANKSVFHKRIVDNYPELVFRTQRVKDRIQAVKEENERVRALLEGRLENVKEEAYHKKSNYQAYLGQVKKVLSLQDQLIRAYRDENLEKKDREALVASLDEEKSKLKEMDIRPGLSPEEKIKKETDKK